MAADLGLTPPEREGLEHPVHVECPRTGLRRNGVHRPRLLRSSAERLRARGPVDSSPGRRRRASTAVDHLEVWALLAASLQVEEGILLGSGAGLVTSAVEQEHEEGTEEEDGQYREQDEGDDRRRREHRGGRCGLRVCKDSELRLRRGRHSEG